MNTHKIAVLETIIKNHLNKKLPQIVGGNSVKLGIKIKEGEKLRIQFYEGIIISKKNFGVNKTFTVRKILQGIGIERCFLEYSPKIDSILIKKSSKIRHSKLYYLRKNLRK